MSVRVIGSCKVFFTRELIVRRAHPGHGQRSIRELTLNDDSGYAADAILLGFRCNIGLLHVVDHQFVRRAGYPPNHFDCLFAR